MGPRIKIIDWLKLLFRFSMPIILISCGDENPINIKFLDIENNQILDSSDLASLRLQGFNRIQAMDYLLNPNDSLSLDLIFNLLDEDSQLTVVGYTDSIITKTGTSIHFKINGRTLEVDMFFQDYPRFRICNLENFITSTNDVRLKVQFLNTINFGPVVSIWNQSSQFMEGRKRNFSTINLNTAECSSLNTMSTINTFGAGVLWGFETYKVKIKSVQRTEAYVL